EPAPGVVRRGGGHRAASPLRSHARYHPVRRLCRTSSLVIERTPAPPPQRAVTRDGRGEPNPVGAYFPLRSAERFLTSVSAVQLNRPHPFRHAMAIGFTGLPAAPLTGNGATHRKHSRTPSAARSDKSRCSSSGTPRCTSNSIWTGSAFPP